MHELIACVLIMLALPAAAAEADEKCLDPQQWVSGRRGVCERDRNRSRYACGIIRQSRRARPPGC